MVGVVAYAYYSRFSSKDHIVFRLLMSRHDVECAPIGRYYDC